jgi:thiamine monophosphate synthase
VARQRVRLPLVAIGGITAANAGQVLAAGPDLLAVVSAVCAAPSPEAAARELLHLVRTRQACCRKSKPYRSHVSLPRM